VANATLASFCAHGPMFPALDTDVTVVGCGPLDPPPRFAPWLGRLTGDRAVPSISGPARACNDVRVGRRGIGSLAFSESVPKIAYRTPYLAICQLAFSECGFPDVEAPVQPLW
jgi:hypothetical protein